MPGSLSILISFIPWIFYWVLSGMGYVFGVIVALLLSTAILIPQFFWLDITFMDVISLIYFSIAALAVYVFNIKVFVEMAGFLGYTVLFLMATLSIVIKQPYTLQVSKRDYPEVYWKDRSFMVINNVITWAWAIIFLLNAAIFLFLGSPLSIILSNTFIVLGIAFSQIFPIKAITHFATGDFKKYDWKVDVNPEKPKDRDEYDVIVVGAGIAGLVCAAMLSKRGYRVLVLEQHHKVGGYCSSFQRKGYVFNTGVMDVSGLWEKGAVNYLLRELGLKKEELFVRNTARIILRGKKIEIRNPREIVEKLSKIFPEELKNIHAFFEDARRAYEECYKEAEFYGVPLPAWLIVKVFGERKLIDYPKEHPHFYDWLCKSYKQKLDEYFRNDDLKAILSANLGYLGTEPEKTPASSALTAALSYFLQGGYFPKPAQKFADSLKNVIESYGGKVLVRHRVEKIVAEGGEVKGVKSRGRFYGARVVVANVNAKTALLELVGEEHLNAKFAEYIKSLKMSPSCFMVFLGVDMDLSGYPTLIKNLDDGYEVVINSNACKEAAPERKASITILAPADYHDFPERGTEEYYRKKKEFAEMLIRKAEKVIPGLSRHIVVKDVATPKTLERYTSMPQGAIYAFDQSVDTKRPYFKTPIKGLYLAGASTFPGGGVEAAVISGIICAQDICGWKTDHGKD